MEKFELPKKIEDVNKFSESTHEELFEALSFLENKKEELQSQLMSYDSDDRQLLENDYNTTVKDLQDVENEIARRADNN